MRKFLDTLYRGSLEWRRPKKNTFDGQDQDGQYFLISPETARHVFVSHARRLGYYSNGVAARLDNLAKEYCVSDFDLSENDVVVDVGAHSGEFGLWAERQTARYLAIEPDPQAFLALRKNMPESSLENVAIGLESGEETFGLATSTGDSSFHLEGKHPTIKVQVRPLDEIVEKHFPEGPITLLKVEAEGHEPEVLGSGRSTLLRTAWVALDAGEERKGKSTAPDCLNFLYSMGFCLEDVFLQRGTFLLRRL